MSTSGQTNLGAGAFSAAPSTIVLIHGLWLTPRSWEHWIERYEELGYRVLAPSWPGMESDVEALNADPSALASLTVEHIVDHYESIVIEVERPPIVMGHSLGGTFTQILLDRGLGAAGVAAASATIEGTRDIPLTAIKVAPPALGSVRKGEPVLLTAQEFHYAFANTVESGGVERAVRAICGARTGGLVDGARVCELPSGQALEGRSRSRSACSTAVHRVRRGPCDATKARSS